MAIGIRLSAYQKSGASVDDFTLGTVYTFGNNGTLDIHWVCCEKYTDYIVLQSQGVTAGTWPGYKMTGPTGSTGTPWGSANSKFQGGVRIDGLNISSYDNKMLALFNQISLAEYSAASYGTALFLVGTNKTGTSSAPTPGTSTYYYYNAHIKAAEDRSQYGTVDVNASHLGGPWRKYSVGSKWYNYTYVVATNPGVFEGDYESDKGCIAPAFNLDPSKVALEGTTIKLIS